MVAISQAVLVHLQPAPAAAVDLRGRLAEYQRHL